MVRTHWSKAWALCVGAAVAVLWGSGALRPQEPTHDGRPLSYWTEHLAGREFGRSYDALRAIGVKGTPWLLREVQKANGLPARCYQAAWPVLPAALQHHLPAPVPPGQIDEKVSHALSVLDSQALPVLLPALEHRNSGVRRVAALAIGKMILTDQVVTQTLSAVAGRLLDSEDSVRLAAMATLERMGEHARVAVPVLNQFLESTSLERAEPAGLGVKARAIRLLGQIGAEASSAAPGLSALLAAPDRGLRTQSAIALWRINRDSNAIPVLVAELQAQELVFSQPILEVLAEVGPAASQAVPILAHKIGSLRLGPSTRADSLLALRALERIDRRAAATVRQSQEEALMAEHVRRAQETIRLFSPRATSSGAKGDLAVP